jgi:GT2 family glycosyltransferase
MRRPDILPSEPDFAMNPIRLFAIIILYKMRAVNSTSYETLIAAAKHVSSEALDLKILLYDNAPDGFVGGELPANVEYHRASANHGLAKPYNFAAGQAENEGYEWLLTLDQDTILPRQFLSLLLEGIVRVSNTPSVAAIVPQIVGDGRVLSPNWLWRDTVLRPFRNGYIGVSDVPVFAFNSATAIRISTLQQVGGYNPLFWLDSSDHEIFRRFQEFGKSVFVTGNNQVDHNFSMLAIEQRMSPERYRNVLLAESAFWDQQMSGLAGMERTLRLAFRYLKQIRNRSDDRYRKISAEFMKRRLLWSKSQRIAAWKKETLQRFPNLAEDAEMRRSVLFGKKHGPKVSVCMAAYNGEKYIQRQLRSILSQLGTHDEIIIVEDKSLDRTAEIILAIKDPRIRLIRHEQNCGVVSTFEDAIRNATGDIIFLSDDDDIWADDKVEKILRVFGKDATIQVVTTRVSVIDEDDHPVSYPVYTNRKKFRSGFWTNILMNHYQGSAMAFRSSLIAAILPLPKDVVFLHDAWIGTRNARLGGGIVYIDEPLIYYRRHQHNYSKRMSLGQRVKSRLQLLLAHLRV